MTVKQIIFASRPAGLPTEANFRFEEMALPSLQIDQVHVKGLFYSVDPYMRGRMNEGKSYIPPFELNEPFQGGAVAVVVESRSPDFNKGDTVIGMLPWATEAVVSSKGLQKIYPSPAIPLSYFLGILGMPGLTAYFGLLDICKPKSGETVVVSGAAGAVGLIVGQIAKIKGCRVIGIAGSDEKMNLLKNQFGFDEVINYKTTSNITNALAQACPNGVDVYFDNVGGEISDAVLNNINQFARIAICGQISMYNDQTRAVGPRVEPLLLVRSAKMEGFIIFNYGNRYPEGIEQLSIWFQEGKLNFTETVVEGFEKLPEALIGLFSGTNTGKMVVKL